MRANASVDPHCRPVHNRRDGCVARLAAARLALPEFGPDTVFVVALSRPRCCRLGHEPAVFGLVKLNPEMFWPAIARGTAGNTLGGAITWWMGYGAERAYERVTHQHPDGRALDG